MQLFKYQVHTTMILCAFVFTFCFSGVGRAADGSVGLAIDDKCALLASFESTKDPQVIRELFLKAKAELSSHILGQDDLLEDVLVALLVNGHILIEGPPGTAKTETAKALSTLIGLQFKRIQFTPDLMPSDLTGTEIYDERTQTFAFRPGPIFADILLADEINRTTQKTQSALLEAMAERQTTANGEAHKMSREFFVIATQNPIESGGTYSLPEAQLDRFFIKSIVGYPTTETQLKILELKDKKAIGEIASSPPQILERQDLRAAQFLVRRVRVPSELNEYIARLNEATQNPQAYDTDLTRWIQHGAGPRAAEFIRDGARARAWLHGRDEVNLKDIKIIAVKVLRHRLILSKEAKFDRKSPDEIIGQIIEKVKAPSPK